MKNVLHSGVPQAASIKGDVWPDNATGSSHWSGWQHARVPALRKETSRLLDGVRGISSLTVVAVHAVQVFLLPYFGMGSSVQLLTSLAATYAVLAFFVVSGFMIAISGSRHRTEDGKFDTVGFAVARILRIYPPLLAAIVLTILVYFVIVGFGLHGATSYRLGGELFLSRERAILEWNALPATILLLYNVVPGVAGPINMDGPLWTLSYEWWCYIVCMLALTAREGRIWSGWVPLLFVVSMIVFGRNSLFWRFAVVWCAGYALGYLYLRGKLAGSAIWMGGLAVLLLGALVWLGYGDLLNALLNPFDGIKRQNMMVLVGILFVVALGIAIDRKLGAGNGPLARVGISSAQFSYTAYIIHYPLLLLGFSLLHPTLHNHSLPISIFAAAATAAAAIFFSAWLSKFVEDRSRIRLAMIAAIPSLRRLHR